MFGSRGDDPLTADEATVLGAAAAVGDGFAVSGAEIVRFIDRHGPFKGVNVSWVSWRCRSLYEKGYMDIYNSPGEPPTYDALETKGVRRFREYGPTP